MRVVALSCSNTEIVCALGCGHLLVGVDDHSDFPEDVVAGCARVGPDLTVDVDKVAALRPDLVIASLTVPGHERVVDGLRAAGLPMIAPEPESLVDLFRDVRSIADALGVPERGEQLVAELKAELVPLPAPERRPRILVEWWPKPVYTPGRRSWVTDLIHLAGGVNPWGEHDACSLAATDEAVQQHRPDAVVISWCGVPTSKYRPHIVTRRAAWAEVPAVKNGHVYPIAEAFLGRPGPRLVQGLRELRAVVERVAAGPVLTD